MSRVFRVKYLLHVFLCGIFLWSVLLWPAFSARAASIFLSEVQVAGDKTADEFVELYNPHSEPFDLAGYQLRRRTASTNAAASSLKVFGNEAIVPGGGYYLWAATEGIFAPPFADTTTGDALASNNSLGLFTKSGASGMLVDSVSWGQGAVFATETPVLDNPAKNQSLARDVISLAWRLSESPTPTNSRGESYVKTPPPSPPPILPTEAAGLRINEFLPDPAGDEAQGEFIELYNGGGRDIDLENFILKDASKSGQYVFPKGPESLIKSGTYLVLFRSAFKFALNNSKETLSLLDPSGATVSTVSYEKTRKNVSLNYSEGSWRGSLHLTPGTANAFNNPPETREKIPKKVYEGIAAEFQARGRDADREGLKYVWDFGDGHKSYKEKTSHAYRRKGVYTVTLKTSDGSEDVIETFAVKVQSFPKYDLRITALLPNPEGKDGDSEWIFIRNKEKKDVNLKGYGIATGSSSDTLTNHPIREDFTLAGGSETKITRDVALFVLPNKKGRAELRAPDGTVLDKVKYKLEKSADEDMVYFKEKGKEWDWKRSEDTAAEQTSEEIENTEAEKDAEAPLPTENVSAVETPGEPLPDAPEEIRKEFDLPPILEGPFVPDENPKDILSYGTGITLSLHDFSAPETVHTVPLTLSSSLEEKIPLEYTGQYISDFNTWINAWLNSPR